MTKELEINNYDGHLLTVIDGMTVLVDTGNPLTFGRNGSIELLGERYQYPESLMSINVEEISRLLNMNVDIVLGMDILRKYRILIDYSSKLLKISSDHIDFQQIAETKMTCGQFCSVDIELNGQVMPMVVDTGAKISYVNPQSVADLLPVAEKNDFYPGYGSFTTPIYQIDATIAGQPLKISTGILPQLLRTTLSMIMPGGVLGYDLFNNYTVLLDFIDNRISIG